MQALFWRIFSAFMAFVFSISGSLPGFISEKLKNPSVESVEVADFGMERFFEDEEDAYRVFFSYSEWQDFIEQLSGDIVKEYAAKFDKSLFEKHNLAVIQITAPSSEPSVYVETAEEKSNVLELEYSLVSEYEVPALAIVCYHTVFAVTSKLVSEVDVTYKEHVNIPVMMGHIDTIYATASYYESAAGDEFIVFSDYESWQVYKETTDKYFPVFEEPFDEYFFVKNNLAMVSIFLDSPANHLFYSSSSIEGGTLTVEYYDIYNGYLEYPAIETYGMMFFATDKNVTSVEAVCLDAFDYEPTDPRVIGIYDVRSSPDEAGVNVISNYEDWHFFRNNTAYWAYDEKFDDIVDEDFFKTQNLVTVLIPLPDPTCSVRYDSSSVTCKGELTVNYYMAHDTSVGGIQVVVYQALILATDKMVSSAEAVCLGTIDYEGQQAG